MIDCLWDPSGFAPGAPHSLSVAPDKGWVLLFGDVDVETGVWDSHDVAGSRVQEDVGCVHPAHPDQTHPISATAVNSVIVCVYWNLKKLIHSSLIQRLTFYVRERRQRWNSFPDILQKTCSLPAGCGALHWPHSACMCAAIGRLSQQRLPCER